MRRRLGEWQNRIIRGHGPWAYLLLALCGLVPIIVSLLTDTALDWRMPSDSQYYQEASERGIPPVFHGYLLRFNWSLLPLILPLGLWVLRWFLHRIVDSRNQDLPLLQRFTDGASRASVERALDRICYDHRLLVTSLAVNALLFAAALRRIVADYLAKPHLPAQPDWCTFFYIQRLFDIETAPKVGIIPNAVLVGTAYFAIFTIMLLGLLLVAVLLHHNLLYLRLVYRRSIVGTPGDPGTHLFLDFDDKSNRCFGLQTLHSTFNLQVMFLIVLGAFLLVGRYATARMDAQTAIGTLYNVVGNPARGVPQAIPKLHLLFPYTDQCLLALGWLACFAVVAIPGLVKFLPLLNSRTRNDMQEYLLEYIPPHTTQGGEAAQAVAVDVDDLAAKFARNSFWPSGDDRARFCYSFAYFVFLVILFPVRFPVGSDLSQLGMFISWLMATLAVACMLAAVHSRFLRFALGHVDKRLVGG